MLLVPLTLDGLNRLSCRILLLLFSLLLTACGGLKSTGSLQTGESPESGPQSVYNVLKITIREEGIYQLSAEEFNASGFGTNFTDTSDLKLYSQWGEHPIWIEGRGEDLLLQFYAYPYKSVYTQENVYWLIRGGTDARRFPLDGGDFKRLPEFDEPEVSALTPEDTFLSRLVVEQNQRYVPQVSGEEHWFWTVLSAPQSENLSFTMAHPASGGKAWLRLDVWGSTEAVESPDHHLILSINDHLIADQEWDGQGAYQIETDFPVDWLNHRQNQLTINAPGDTGVSVDLVQIDKITFLYPRMGIAQNDRLIIPAYRKPLSLSGFSAEPKLFNISNPRQAKLVQEKLDVAQPLEGVSGHRYMVVGPQGYLTPVSVSSWDMRTDLRATDQGADYLAIGPSHLLEPLNPLLNLRQGEGLTTRAIPLEDVYDLFNFGLPEPDAILNFIRFASGGWVRPPKYILLVGDATYDPKGYIATPEANQLPTFLVDTVYGGETASDIPFAQLDQGTENEDPWPDLAVGRIPAQSPEQVAILVEKILDYEQNLVSNKPINKILALADGQETYFKRDAQSFLDLFPANVETELYAPPPGVGDANSTIHEYFYEDNQLIAYFGHGSINMWGKDRLFSTEDVGSLTNRDSLPVVLNMTCLTGLFTHPRVDSLAESLLWNPDGGAVAVLAPTSLTLPTDQSFLTNPFVEHMLAYPDDRLGDILLKARREVPQDQSGTRDVMETFLLFGDPALNLAER